MVALISATLVGTLLIIPVFLVARRRPVGTPLTWGEAVVAGVYCFFIMFWIYGVIPHSWLTWADSELNWRPDRIWFGPEGKVVMPITGWSLATPWFPIKVSAQVFRDVIVDDHLRGAPGRSDLDLVLVAEAWHPRRGGRGHRARVRLRPSPHEAGLRSRSTWAPPTPILRCRSSATTTSSRRSTPTTWPRPSSRSSSSTSTSPSASCARDASTSARGSASTWSPPRPSTSRSASIGPVSTRPTTCVFLIDDDVCTRCALCVDRCPTGVIIMGKVGDPAAAGDPHQRTSKPRLRLRHAARVSRDSTHAVRAE